MIGRAVACLIGSGVLLSAVIAATAAAAELEVVMTTPLATIESLQRGLVAVAAPGSTTAERYARLVPLISQTHNLEYIATVAVRRDWDTFDADQRVRYLAAFARLSIMSYASRFGSVGDDSFVAPATQSAAPDSAEITSAIRGRDGAEISLDYALRLSDEGWRIVNIVADGVSDLALKRAEYRRILADGTPDVLIAELERQVEALEKGR